MRNRELAGVAVMILLCAYGLREAPDCEEYVVVDTGQHTCYDDSAEIPPPDPGEPFYGQDAQYAGTQPSYTISGDGLTVYDNNTDLTWIRTPDTDGDGDIDVDDKWTYYEAQTYPDTLNAQNYGGYSDWRVPTIKELYSLIDFRGTDPDPMSGDPTGLIPFIDTTYFAFAYGDVAAGERIIDSQWVTSSLYIADSTMMFGVNFADGRIKGYGLTMPGGDKTFYVRLCRGNPGYGVNDFSDNGDGTITDNATGLMWSQDDRGDGVSTGPRSGMIWEDALAWVEQKNAESYLGHNDWRLPNAKEMQSIVDYSRAPGATGSAAIDPVFNTTEITNEAGEADYPWFWTGTTHVRQGGGARSGVYICFGRAFGYMNGDWVDIHGAGAQRSDRKDGDFSDYIYVPDGYYHPGAPQGDAVRIYNYVRCVRGGFLASDDPACTAPKRSSPGQNYPDPFASRTSIPYRLFDDGEVRIGVYDLMGREVRSLVSGLRSAGSHEVVWDGTNQRGEEVGPGVYFYRLETADKCETNGMVLTR